MVVTVCAGANGDFETVLTIHREITVALGGVNPKSTQLDLFVLRRVTKLIDKNGRACNCSYYKLLVYELLYLWNALPSSSRESLATIITGKLITGTSVEIFF